jgi:transcriptional regulator with XRE-family HTH domain
MTTMRTMSAQAVGGFFRALVEKRPDLTYTSVTKALGVKPNYLYRLEMGDSEKPEAQLIVRLVNLFRAPVEYVDQLFNNPDATAEEGRALADEWYASLSDEDIDALIAHYERTLGKSNVLQFRPKKPGRKKRGDA